MTAANVLTGIRLFMTFVLFGTMAVLNGFAPEVFHETVPASGIFAFVVLLFAIGTDFFDGYLARKMGTESGFGRMADPLVDKVLICGTLVMLLGLPRLRNALQEWMVVIVISRELLIQGVRSGMEKCGIEFPAMVWGKLKMVVQSSCVVLSLLYGLVKFDVFWFTLLVYSSIWLMVLITLLSGMIYFYHAIRLSRHQFGEQRTP